jgi:tRNA U34 5-carboxymethylaminomethyl modifying GTPase MnmE/TrmE
MDWYLTMLNEKQEKFCQAYVLHRNATEAARAAGYAAASANNQGYRLLQSDEVTERIHELEQELETNVDVIEEIESQYTYAKTNGHTNSAIKALELLSRIRGANSDININMDEETLETAIVGCLNVLGEEKVYDLLSKCDFTEDEENGGPESVTEGPSLESLDLPLPEEADSSV